MTRPDSSQYEVSAWQHGRPAPKARTRDGNEHHESEEGSFRCSNDMGSAFRDAPLAGLVGAAASIGRGRENPTH